MINPKPYSIYLEGTIVVVYGNSKHTMPGTSRYKTGFALGCYVRDRGRDSPSPLKNVLGVLV